MNHVPDHVPFILIYPINRDPKLLHRLFQLELLTTRYGMKSSKMDFVQKPPNPEINGAQIRYIIVTRFFYGLVIFAFQIEPD